MPYSQESVIDPAAQADAEALAKTVEPETFITHDAAGHIEFNFGTAEIDLSFNHLNLGEIGIGLIAASILPIWLSSRTYSAWGIVPGTLGGVSAFTGVISVFAYAFQI